LDCQSTAKVIVSVIDRSRLVESLKGEDFFKLRRRFGTKQDGKPASPATINGHIRRTVAIFNFAVKEGLVDRVVYGADFKGFTEKQKTDLQQRAADKVLNREAVRQLLAAANYRFRAMLLLGINCGMGNTDVANLRIEDLELEGGWYESRRSKTSVRRCSKLWPETVDALRVVLARRFKHRDKSDAGLVFITRYGRSYRDQAAITHEFQSVKEASKIKTPKGAGFYSLRHTLRTVAGRWADETAIRWIMGHKRSRIDDHYIHAPPKDRIAELSEKVRTWLFSGEVVR
jgi:integrase